MEGRGIEDGDGGEGERGWGWRGQGKEMGMEGRKEGNGNGRKGDGEGNGKEECVREKKGRGGCGRGGCYTSRQTYIEVNDTYSEGGTYKETLHPQSKAKVMNKR